MQCFQGCLHGKDGSSNVLCQLQWLLELMGHVARTVETTVVTDTTTQPPTQKVIIIIIIAEMTVFNVAGYLIEERRRWPVITASPQGQHSK